MTESGPKYQDHPDVIAINQRNQRNRENNIRWAKNNGYEVDSKGHIFDPDTKKRVALLTRLDADGNDLVEEAPSVHPFPSGYVLEAAMGDLSRGLY